ncbi:hypothetical protein CAOG_07884 [Capsaspora owczarzaki ATCC 30864]|uniref:Ketoreductase domain-containing protein n=1 Tax=Capsaspora owczarzaki (strain ATCC 30864) TaxID=595528 RepID=A0A0D2WXB1_CAPO3|nr:hypothetical protein CAOG_07884 [Capsaspora owczarzaki ATCC 30864]KJE97785.1 hypothetical protein CAOG_007884 [Capsaspora owczarzaki ATCC 30864]|eukprot:XP_004342969.1 hypothetical protein CAOG_07884 [Capsaspora owczarzaki ATCC 30864]
MSSSSAVVIVTGASRGIGLALATILVKDLNARIVINGRTAGALDELAASLNAHRADSCVAVAGDVADRTIAKQLVDTAIQRYGAIDAVVNNAALLEPVKRIADVDPGEWAELMRINIQGPLNLTQLAIPHLRASKGRVVHVSSGAATSPMVGAGAYSVSKAGLNMFSRVLAAEEPEIVSVAVKPGVVDTAMQVTTRGSSAQAVLDPATAARFINLKSSGEILQPEVPARALAVVALRAPSSFSGEFFVWNDERIAALY